MTALSEPLTTDPYPHLSAPAGPEAARTIAQRHAAAGHHTHLITDGETECLSGHCLTAQER